MNRLIILSILFALLFSNIKMQAQESPYKFDVGGGIGMSGYLGDANNSSILKHPGFTADFDGRYIANARYGLRALLGVTTLSGNTADMENVLPGFADYKFSSTVFDLSIRGEFNFFAYGIGETFKRLRRFSPYITLGIGVCMSSCDGDIFAAPTIPMGVGVKYKLKERLNLTAEFTMTKVFGDKVDGALLNDLTGIRTEFFKNTDWFSRLSIGISYEFGERCETCHYVD